MNFIKKLFIGFFIFSLAMPLDTILAATFPSPIQSMNEILDDLEVDKEELKKTINNTVDSSNYKAPAPSVTFTFAPATPASGKEITAVASPTYFTGDTEKMYYTWYLKRKEKTDWNRDDRVDIEDYKIEAMRLIANGGEDASVFNYTDPIGDDDGYEAVFGGEDQKEKNVHCYVKDIDAGVDYEIPRCRHLFPDTDGHGTVGDGNFGKDEEEFWGTDPESKDTNNDGVPDEKALTGLGIMSFTWIYAEGDQIGVAIEGIAEATDYPDSSYKTMWALPNDEFDSHHGNCDMSADSGKEGFITSSFELNDCLEANLIDPAEGTVDKKIGIDLIYSPKIPLNDPREQANNSDKLNIRANLSNIEDASFVKYKWQFSLCPDASGLKNCEFIPQNILNATGIAKTEGLGIDTVDMKLNLDTPRRYLKVEVRVLETTQGVSGKSGQGKIVIPFQQSQDGLEAFFVSANSVPQQTNGVDVALQQTSSRESLCDGKTCSAVKNEIIGIRFNNNNIADKILSWSLNGKPLIASENDPKTVYFPILKDTGSIYSVKLDIANTEGSKLGKEKITLLKDFKVEEPRVEIGPTNCASGIPNSSCRPKELGVFKDPYNPDDETRWEKDYSQDIFQVDENVDSLVIEPSFFNFDRTITHKDQDPSGNWKIRWIVDGSIVEPTAIAPAPHMDPLTGNLNLPIQRDDEDKHTISLEVFYTQTALIKKALYKIWSVPKDSFYEKKISDSMEIEVVEAPATSYQSGTKKILASVFSGLPNYVNFLFRTVLTLALILFLANMSFILFPKQDRY